MLPNQPRRSQSELNGRRTNQVLTTLNQHMQLYGYSLIELPIIDSADLFLVKAGDQIINSLFTFERHGKQFALRPEFTASAADYFANTVGETVVRWHFAGPVFEDSFHESSSNYEQLGIGAELIGLGGSLADAEIIAMSAIGLDKLNIADTYITIGHVGLIRELLKQFNLDVRTQRFLLHHLSSLNDPNKGKRWIFDQFSNQFSSMRKQSFPTIENYVAGKLEFGEANSNALLTMGGRTQDDIMRRMILKQQRLADSDNVAAAIDYLDKWCQISDTPDTTFTHLSKLVSGNKSATHLLQEWRDVISLLGAHQIPLSRIAIKPNLARSWEYYTGIVFELHSNGIHLGGGGRYDELAQLIGSKVGIPAVGFAYYGNRLINTLSNISLDVIPLIIITSNNDDMINATKWANQIRNHGLSVQIFPQAVQKLSTAHEIFLENATTAHFQTAKYDFKQIEVLINDLKRIQ